MPGSFLGGLTGGVIGSVVVRILADRTGLDTGFKDAEKSAQAFGQAMTRVGIATTAAMAAIGVASVKSFIDFESSVASMAKTIEATGSEFDALVTANRELAKTIPISVNALNEVSAAAGQLGIETENITSFTKTMAELGVTTNLSADVAATALARLANITQMPQDQFQNLGSTIVALGNNFATTEAEIVEFSLRVAGAGSVIGLSEAEILGFATALSSVGLHAEAGGTAISRVFIEIDKAVRTGGESLETFASVAGMSAAEFQQAYGVDAAGAIITFIEGLGKINEAGGDVFATLSDLELADIRVRDALLRAAGAGDELRNAITLANTAWQENTALTEEAEKRYATTASQLKIAGNRMQDVAITLGSRLAPALASAAGGIAELVENFGELPVASQNLILLGATMIGLTPILATIGTRIAAIIKTIQTLGVAALGLGVKLTAAMGAIGIIIGGIEVLSQLTTGKGILDHLFGSGEPNRSERVAAALERIQFAVTSFSGELDMEAMRQQMVTSWSRAFQEIFEQLDEFSSRPSGDKWQKYGAIIGDMINRGALDELATLPQEIQDKLLDLVGDDIKADIEAQAQIIGNAMKAGILTPLEVLKQREAVPDLLRPIFDRAYESIGGIGSIVNLYVADVDRANTSQAEWMKSVEATSVAAQEGANPINSLSAAAAGLYTNAKSVGQAFREDMEPAVGSFDDAAEQTEMRLENFADALVRLTEAFSTTNVAAEYLRFTQAVLNEELGDLAAKGDMVTEAEAARALQIEEELIPALEKELAVFEENQAAIEGMLPLLQMLVGDEGMGALMTAMESMGLSQEKQIEVMRILGQSMVSLRADGIDGAIAGFQQLHDVLGDGAAWDEIVQTIGPQFVDKINALFSEGIIDESTRDSLMADVRETFGSAVDGGVDAVSEAGKIGSALLQAVGAALGTDSPEYQALAGALDTVMSAISGEGVSNAAVASAIGKAFMTAISSVIDINSPEGQAILQALDAIIVAAGGESILSDAEAAGSTAGESIGTGVGKGILKGEPGVVTEMAGIYGAVSGTAGDAEAAGVTTGSAVGRGVASGIYGSKAQAEQAAADLAASVNQIMQGVLYISSPSKLIADEVGKPIAEGLAAGIEAGTPIAVAAAVSAVETVVNAALSTLGLLLANPKGYGDPLGAGEGLIAGLTEEIEEEVHLIAGSMEQVIGQIHAFADATGTDSTKIIADVTAIFAAIAAGSVDVEEGLGDIASAFEDFVSDVESGSARVTDVIGTFNESIKAILDDKALTEYFGTAGRRIIDAMTEALQEGSQEAIMELADMAVDMEEALRDGLSPAAADALVSAFNDALVLALTTGGEEALTALQDLLHKINLALGGAAVDAQGIIQLTAEQVEKLAEDLGVSAEDIVNSIDILMASGLLSILGQVEGFSDEAKAIIAQLIADVLAGVKTVEEAIAGIGSAAGLGPEGDARAAMKKENRLALLRAGEPYETDVNGKKVMKTPFNVSSAISMLDKGAISLSDLTPEEQAAVKGQWANLNPTAPRPWWFYGNKAQYTGAPGTGYEGSGLPEDVYWGKHSTSYTDPFTGKVYPPGVGYFGPVAALASGGIVNRQMFAKIGEVPEAVIPLKRGILRHLLDLDGGIGGLIPANFAPHIEIHGRGDADEIIEALNRWWQEMLHRESSVLARVDGVGF